MKSPLARTIATAILVTGWGVSTNPARAVEARSVTDFLNSTGVCVHVQHNMPADKLVEPLKYVGVRNVRDGADTNYNMAGLILLHQQAGVLVAFGPGSGAKDESLPKTLAACRELAAAGALLAVEGPNEPNNFGGVTYQGLNSTKLRSWLPVANYQMDLYHAVKSDPILGDYPVWSISEAGAEEDNCGLQYLVIPEGANTRMPDGVRFADFVNCHNYVSGHITGIIDNQATLAASTRPKAAIDHLYGNHGCTWHRWISGYTEKELDTIPKVTTETGWKSDDTPAGDDLQGKVLLNVFLAQFKAGWKHTFVYEFTDDADGSFGYYKGDFKTPRPSAVYLHNLTTILADSGKGGTLGTLDYSIQNASPTVHDLLLQKSDGTFTLIIWGEQVQGKTDVTVDLGANHSVKIYDPTFGITPIRTLDSTKSFSLTVSDHALVLEVK